ncbi:serine O-acetyltransferase [Wenzhouxiangella sediminis]|jgi:serine O-acetyltransferase|uniref:Serine acetyltransferase n=1 Tax=Wenzhouxiangella sediminis TaxID=1792836 RepID=A0A3E1KAV4_9GAMM|nr:DapH/DapD/GlmU-related protein [Wenzhouxiangella sediminis]MEE4303030.1 DapH/DapD/GlmU-related protein [Wenzhouxiangella sp.]RFF31579.1 serine acetyltransferase [Wenzhouxiangella sediminis]
MNPSSSERGALRADFKRYLDTMTGIHGSWRARLAAATEFGFLAIAVYRFGRLARRIRPRLLGWPLKIVYRVLNFFVEILFGISLSTNSRIGRGFYIGHFGGIVVHGNLGEGCSIGQGVTVGSRGAGRSDGYPEIGDRVYLGAGAMVIGRVHVGDDVVVGANTVVVSDIPAGCRVVSAPARILPPRSGASAPASDPRECPERTLGSVR